MKEQFNAFIDDLRSSHGANLVAVILYGSAAAGDFINTKSDYNLLIALDKIGPRDLRNAHASIREWARLGHPVPVYFTASELQDAADVFPIEFHSMSVAHKVLYGRDVLEGLQISDKFLRHQAEYELRSKLLQLRRQYIPASGSADGLCRLMADSLSSFSALFRAVLLLRRGVEPPATKHEIIDAAATEFGLERSVFDKIFAIREEGRTLGDGEANDLFGGYMIQIEKVIDSVDKTGEQ